MSVPQMVVVVILTKAWSGPICGTGLSSSTDPAGLDKNGCLHFFTAISSVTQPRISRGENQRGVPVFGPAGHGPVTT